MIYPIVIVALILGLVFWMTPPDSVHPFTWVITMFVLIFVGELAHMASPAHAESKTNKVEEDP